MIWIASSAPAGGTRGEMVGVVPVLWESVRHHQAEMVQGPSGREALPQHLGGRTGSQPLLTLAAPAKGR